MELITRSGDHPRRLLAAGRGGYVLQELTTAAEVAAIAEPWQQLREGRPPQGVGIPPETALFEAGLAPDAELRVVALWRDKRLLGVAPLLLRRRPLQYRIGYRVFAEPSMLFADLLGNTLLACSLDEESRMLEYIVRHVAEKAIVSLRAIPTESALGQLTRDSQELRAHAWVYNDSGAQARRMIELGASMEGYLAGFSGKTRRTWRYSVNKLHKHVGAELQLHCLRRPDEVPQCRDWLQRISNKSWQATLLDLGHGPDRPERLAFWAERGWLRAYFLTRGDQPLAFVVGRQEAGVFLLAQTAFDHEWFEFKVGTVLLYKLLEDLYRSETPRWFDFGTGDMEYKERFCNTSHQEASWLIANKSLATGCKLGSYAACQSGMRFAREKIDQLGLLDQWRNLRSRYRQRVAGKADGAEPSASEPGDASNEQ